MKKHLPLKPSAFFPSLASFAFFLIWSAFLYFGLRGLYEVKYDGAMWDAPHIFLAVVAFIGGQAVIRYIATYLQYLWRVHDMQDEVPLKIERTYRKPLRLTILFGISSGSVQLDNEFKHTPLYQGFIGLQATSPLPKTGQVITYTTQKSPEHVLVISPSPVKH